MPDLVKYVTAGVPQGSLSPGTCLFPGIYK